MKDICAIIKEPDHSAYDMPDSAWRDYADAMVSAIAAAGFTAIDPPAHKPAQDKDDTQYMDKKLYLMDRAHEASLGVVLQPGNARSRKWGAVYPGSPFRALYEHPSVIAVRIGDEPDSDGNGWKRDDYDAILAEYPDTSLICAMIGEAIGGPSGLTWCSNDMIQDRMPQYENLWAEYPNNHIPTVRNYPFRYRNKSIKCDGVVVGQEVGAYDLYNPYTPGKLAVPVEEMARIMDSRCDKWNLVAPAFGKCFGVVDETGDPADECYWALPTYNEVMRYGAIAEYSNVDMLMFWGVTSNKDGHVNFFGDDYEKTVHARDGSVPVDAIRTLSNLYL